MNTYIVDCCDFYEKPENLYVIIMANTKEEAIERVQKYYPNRKVECTGPVNEQTFMLLQWRNNNEI